MHPHMNESPFWISLNYEMDVWYGLLLKINQRKIHTQLFLEVSSMNYGSELNGRVTAYLILGSRVESFMPNFIEKQK